MQIEKRKELRDRGTKSQTSRSVNNRECIQEIVTHMYIYISIYIYLFTYLYFNFNFNYSILTNRGYVTVSIFVNTSTYLLRATIPISGGHTRLSSVSFPPHKSTPQFPEISSPTRGESSKSSDERTPANPAASKPVLNRDQKATYQMFSFTHNPIPVLQLVPRHMASYNLSFDGQPGTDLQHMLSR